MFERFSPLARDAILRSQKEARDMGHHFLGTEHLMLALALTEGGNAAHVLDDLGLTPDAIRRAITNASGGGDKTNQPQGELPFTPRAKKVLENSLREALALGHDQIGTEHLLLGLIRETEGLASKLLHDAGFSDNQIREAIFATISHGDQESSPQAEQRSERRRSNRKNSRRSLEKFARNLTELAREGKLDPMVGRDTEVERMMQILVRRTKCNPVLVGEPGVGKTAVVEGLAQKIAQGQVPQILKDSEVYSLDLALMVAGTKLRGEFEERLKKLIDEVKESNIILFIDEIHSMVGAGSAEGSLDAVHILKPALSRGEFQVIGATTLKEFRIIEKDPALARRFQQVTVDPPSTEETLLILQGLRDAYEQHHNVEITDEALQAAVELSERYIADRFLPDKAIDIVDESASRVHMRKLRKTSGGKMEELENIQESKIRAIAEQRFEEAADFRDRELQLKAEINDSQPEGAASDRPKVLAEDAADVVAMWTGIPVNEVSSQEAENLLSLEGVLAESVVGQQEAVHAVARSLRRSRAGFRDQGRPLGSFLFLGPTGVGKTELARTLASHLFGDKDAMIRLDMSEYMEAHSVSRLVGSPPGYVGHGEGGQLSEPVRRKPYCVLLLDEIEKAHPDVSNILLQVLEDGHITDSTCRRVSFQNAIIIATSNLGAQSITRERGFGFTPDAGMSHDDMRKGVMDSLKGHFRPELINRLDEIVVFNRLQAEDLVHVVDLLCARLHTTLEERGVSMTMTNEAKQLLAQMGYDPTMGARPLRRTIQRELEDPLAEMMLGGMEEGTKITVDAEDDKLVIEQQNAAVVEV